MVEIVPVRMRASNDLIHVTSRTVESTQVNEAVRLHVAMFVCVQEQEMRVAGISHVKEAGGKKNPHQTV